MIVNIVFYPRLYVTVMPQKIWFLHPYLKYSMSTAEVTKGHKHVMTGFSWKQILGFIRLIRLHKIYGFNITYCRYIQTIFINLLFPFNHHSISWWHRRSTLLVLLPNQWCRNWVKNGDCFTQWLHFLRFPEIILSVPGTS